MIICFECQAGTKKLLDELVASGGYHDFADVIAAAVANQALLHSKVGEQGSIVIADTSENRGASRIPGRNSDRVSGPSARKLRSASASPNPDASASGGGERLDLRVPELFVLNGMHEAAGTPAARPDDVWVPGQEVPISRWLFGQYNKLLPAKASCRALAHLLTSEPDGVSLSSTAPKIAEAAAHLGDYLATLDAASGATRDEALATAFPKTGQGGDKSRLRYASQFVAWINSHGQISGLLMGVKLINRTSHKDPRIKLTDAGWRFALLGNPVLDAAEASKASKLSNEERALLLEHIASSVAAEDFAYRAVLKGIADGANTPESLDEFLVRRIPAGTDELTKEFVATQRSGVVSRMIDLGLLARVRDGVRVSYAATERATGYLMQESKR